VYSLSNKPKLLNDDLPVRASKLASRLADTIETLMKRQKGNRELKSLLRAVQYQESWIDKVQKLFLDSLKFILQLKQANNRTILKWPKKNANFNGDQMCLLDSGDPISFHSQQIVLIVMPAAIIQGAELETKYRALVYLNNSVCLP